MSLARLDRRLDQLRAELILELADMLDEALGPIREQVADLDRRLTNVHEHALRLLTQQTNRRPQP